MNEAGNEARSITVALPMVDAVARALCLMQFGDEAIHGDARCCQAGGKNGCCIAEIVPQARAAIKAMREPTNPMVDAAHAVGAYWHHEVCELVSEWREEMRQEYRAMIDAALEQ